MFTEFKAFLTKTNALALAVGFIIGAASGKVVTAVVQDLLMPVLGLVLPAGDWRTAKFALGSTGKAIQYGDFLGNAVDFVIISWVAFLITRALLKPAPVAPTQTCPFCKEANAVDASRCKACTSNLGSEPVTADKGVPA